MHGGYFVCGLCAAGLLWRCSYEGVLFTGGKPTIVKHGTEVTPELLASASTYADLLKWRISCVVCGDEEDAQNEAAIGFLCVTEKASPVQLCGVDPSRFIPWLPCVGSASVAIGK
jgi:hypothetical protein